MAEYTTTEPEVREYPERRILYVTRKGHVDQSFMHAAVSGAEALFGFIEEHDIPYVEGTYMGIVPDNPAEVAPADLRYISAVVIDEDTQIPDSGDAEVGTLPGGRDLVVLHTGPLDYLSESWMKLYQYNEVQGMDMRAAVYEVYVDDPPTTPPEQQRMELHIPIH